jgi:serine/threonine-protein kinase
MTERPPAAAHDATPDRAGRMAGEYRLGRKLGEGGFGAVYEAEHPLLKRRAAVKVLHRVAEQDSDAVQRFISEAQAVNQIRSPHIVDIFSFGQLADGRHFYVMDLLEGEPLDRFLARMQRVDVAVALQLLRPIAEALDAAHAAGIVHRDLKPQNIFLAWNAQGFAVPKLLDFGMAKLLGDVSGRTVSGTPMGTPLYMSPEQARGQKVEQRSDVYALGVLVHELLTGSLPILGETTIAVLMAHISQEPPRVSAVCPDLPAALDAPILRMLDKQPEQRPSSAGAALAALSEAAESAGIVVPAGLPQLPRPAPPPISQRPGELSGTLAAVSPSAQHASEPSVRPAAAASARPAHPARWAWLGAAIVALGFALFLLTRDRSEPGVSGPHAAPPASVGAAVTAPEPLAAPTQPFAAPPALEEAGALVPTRRAAEADVSAPEVVQDAAASGAKRRKAAASQDKRPIPRDLENPF